MSLTHEGHYGKLNIPIETEDGKFIYLAYQIEDGGFEPVNSWLVSDQNAYIREIDRDVIEKYTPILIDFLEARWRKANRPDAYIEQKKTLVIEAFERAKAGLKVVTITDGITRDALIETDPQKLQDIIQPISPEPNSLESLTVADIKDILDKREILYPSKAVKADLIDLLLGKSK